MSQQVNFHNHGEHSFLDGLSHVAESIDRIKELGQSHMVLTDHGECGGHPEAARLCAKAGIGFIPGMEGYWLPTDELYWHRHAKKYPYPSHICLIAQNNEGLRNLWRLSSEAYGEKHFYYKPIATPELLKEYSAGLYASDGCMMTQFSDAIDIGDEDKARQLLSSLLDIYRENFYVELHTWQFMDGGKPEQMTLNARMTKLNHAKVRLANEMGIPMVIVNDSHHARPDQWYNRELVWAFNTSHDSDKKLGQSLGNAAQKADHIMGDDELYYWMRRHKIADDVIAEAIKNSAAMAEKCQVDLKPTMAMPRLCDSEHDDLVMLIDACEKGMKRFITERGLEEQPYLARLEEELTLISQKHFAGYFNVVADCAMAFRSGSWSQFVKKGADKEPLLLGPGRGSAGGSLVAYLTGITLIDPLKYGTLFSRFLSPGRKGLPDIDMDVPQSQRPDVLKYLRKRFGEENVCAIGTFSRSGVKQTLRDVGNALQIGRGELDGMSEHIADLERLKDPDDPDDEALTWAELLERKGGVLRPYQVRYPHLFDKMEEMTGLIRQSSVHASGVLISAEPIRGLIPLRIKNKTLATQFDMNDVEFLGGVKYDWLGLRHLDTITRARQMIYDRHKVWIDFDNTGLSVPKDCTEVITFSDEHFNDPAIWDQITEGQTLGIFQLGTPFATEVAMRFKPRTQVDIADLTAVLRPGVGDAGLTDVYLERRAGKRPVIYDHPLMEKFLGPKWSTNTYGVLVYQEQFIQCVEEVAGFTKDESDTLRKAVGKKDMTILMPLKEKFIAGCIANPEYMAEYAGDPDKQARGTAERIWSSIEAAGRYAFNWSHAVEYGAFISTWEIWLKYYYPQEFIVSCMQTEASKINLYLREARKRKIAVLPPDINKSATKFTIEGEDIRYGIDTVRDVGPAAAKDIRLNRPFKDLADYCARAGEAADKSVVYNLILIGAFDEMGSREEMLHQLERIRAMKGLAQSTLEDPAKLEERIAIRLSNNPEEYLFSIPDFQDRDVLYEIEKELVGTYVTVDPLERYAKTLEKSAIADPLDVVRYTKGDKFVIGGELTAIRPTKTKKGRNPGQDMASLTVTWNEADFRIVCFPQVWSSVKSLLSVGVPVACEVKRLDSGCCLEGVERLDLLFDREGIT